MEYIKEFNRLNKADVSIAGGKGASLGEMTQSGIPVPPGFVILSNAFEKFIEITDINVEIDAILDKVDIKEMHTVENASEEIQALILNESAPKEIEKEINKSFKQLKCEFVAVRSSATSEDSASAAWAGQLESFLNTTKENLLDNVRKCWASLFTPRAIFYRFEQKLNNSKISVAVVVQKMVESEKSGIAFSVHPVTQDYNQLIIEAGFGLGEAIVSGQITPDSYVVDKQDKHIIDINVSEQQKALYRKKEGGNEWKELGEKGKEQVLNKEKIIELADLIIKIEKHYGFPVDVEWAYEQGKFYIVQSRPITTLKKEEKSEAIFDWWLSRPYPILQIEAYNNFLEDISKEINYPVTRPIFIYNAEKKLVTLYYNMKELLPGISKIGEKITKEFEFRRKIFSESIKVFEQVKKYFDGELLVKSLKEFENFFRLFQDYMKYVAYIWVLPGLDFVPSEIKEEAMKIREKTEDYAGRRDSIMVDFANSIIKDREVDAFFLTLDEIKKREKDIKRKYKERKNGFLFYKGEVVPKDEIPSFLEINNFEIREPEAKNTEKITGAVAQKGRVKGIVRIVYTEDELGKINEGDILVTNMTRPEFVPAMKKAGAVVTDEGGVVCHAAIVARELKKPCIIGTKIATKVLHDGDYVEVDADKGVVRILEKAGEKKKGKIKLEKFYSREYCLFNVFVWRDGNCVAQEKDLGYNIQDVIYIYKNKNLDVYYDNNELLKFREEISRRIKEDEKWFDSLAGKFQDLWKELFQYISKKKKIKSVKELRNFYNNWVNWWTPLAIIMQIPEISGISDKIKQKAIKLRSETQEHSDKGTEVFLEFFNENYPEYQEIAYLITPEEVFSLEKGKLTEGQINLIKEREDGFVLLNDKEILEKELGAELKSRGLVLEGEAKEKVFTKEHSREYSLFRVASWYNSMQEGLQKIVGKGVDEACAVYKGGGLVGVYYEPKNLQEEFEEIVKKCQDVEYMKKEISNFLKLFARLKEYYIGNKKIKTLKELRKVQEMYSLSWAYIAIIYTIPRFPVDESLKQMSYKAREETQEYNEASEYLFKDFLEKHYPQLKGMTRFILPEEVWNKEVEKPDFKEKIKEREKGFIYYKNQIYVGDIQESLSKLGVRLEDQISTVSGKAEVSENEVKGQIAFKGNVRGIVKVVNAFKDISKVNEGDILVTAMTMPKYLPAMKKAAAFVTDEGGITCHAAIVSREMKKPCIIGTKVATQVLHDGDLVEVDADNGVVRILEKAGEGGK